MRAAAILEAVYPANPRHPGVLHYLIHSYDDPVHAPLGMRAARVYGSVAPNAGHALHMTSHIFIAMGMWDDVIDANRRAIAVVNRQRAERKKQTADCGHYPTWLHYGYLQKGDFAAARKALDDCRTSALVVPFESAGAMDSKRSRVAGYAEMRAHHVASGQPLTAADAVTIPEGAELAEPRFTIAYADVLLAAQKADVDALKKAVTRLRALRAELTDRRTAATADVMVQEADALLLAATGKRAEAIALLDAASKAEAAMPFEFGPPVLAKPAAELLGDQLLAAGRTADAEAAYRTALARTPGRAVLVAAMAKAGKPPAPKEKAAEEHVH
jgi:hypothetical protein